MALIADTRVSTASRAPSGERPREKAACRINLVNLYVVTALWEDSAELNGRGAALSQSADSLRRSWGVCFHPAVGMAALRVLSDSTGQPGCQP